MNIISLEQENSSFISNTEPDKNFSALDYISVSSYALRNCESNKCISYLNFNLDLFSCQDIIIHSAKLLIPLEIYKMNPCLSPKEILLSFITEDFSYKDLTWNNQPKTIPYKKVTITKNEIKSNCIAIDVTSLVCQWIYNNMDNYGIRLSVYPPNIMIILPKNKIKYSPKLVINYSNNQKSISIPTILYLRSTTNQTKLINPNERIIMNEITLISPEGIKYNSTNGVITISKTGYYNFQFALSIIGTCSDSKYSEVIATVSLKNLTTNKTLDFHLLDVIPAEMHGYGIIFVEHENEEFVLINNSPKILQLADVPIQSSFAISIIE